MSIIFGPINSRRFGKSLGIDLSPNKKQCNFDCLYCELKSAKVVDSYSDIVDIDLVINEVKEVLKKYKTLDVLTITANGEPTLYPKLDELINRLNSIKKDTKSLILSNSSTIYKKDIQNSLAKVDMVKLSLDCATANCFKKLDRASKSVDLEKIKRGILEFAKEYKGELIIEILFVKGINDNLKEIKELNEFLVKLKPSRVDLSTIHRPPAYKIEPISYQDLHKLSLHFDKSLNITIAGARDSEARGYNYTKEEILQTLHLRPLTKEDIDILFSNESKEIFNTLLEDRLIEEIKSGNLTFYRSKE